MSVFTPLLKKVWSTNFPGYLKYASELGNNILVVFETDGTMMINTNSEFKAVLLNSANGEIVKESMLFKGNNDFLTFPYLMVTKDKKSFLLATRETGLKRNVKFGLGAIGAMYAIKKTDDQGNQTNSFIITKFDSNLNQIAQFSPDLPDGDFIGVDASSDNSIYLASVQDNSSINISKYNFGVKSPIKVLTENVSFNTGLLKMDRINKYLGFSIDTAKNNLAYVYGCFDSGDGNEMLLSRFNFVSGKVDEFS